MMHQQSWEKMKNRNTKELQYESEGVIVRVRISGKQSTMLVNPV